MMPAVMMIMIIDRELLLLQEKMKMFEMLKEEEVLSAILNSKLKDELEYQKKVITTWPMIGL